MNESNNIRTESCKIRDSKQIDNNWGTTKLAESEYFESDEYDNKTNDKSNENRSDYNIHNHNFVTLDSFYNNNNKDNVGNGTPEKPRWPNVRKIPPDGLKAWDNVKTVEDVKLWHSIYTPQFSSKDVDEFIKEYNSRLQNPKEEFILQDCIFNKLLKITK